jgi:cytochrome c biogenesis protein CcmG/thiol:disulfide interchange protein DsbE
LVVKRNAFVFAVLAVAILGMLTFGKWVDRQRQKRPNTALVGDVRGVQAPDFDLVTLDGRKVKLSDYRGKAVILNFWATWCAPCKVEMPWFVDLQNHYGKEGLTILGIAMDDSDPQKIAQFASEMGVNYPVLLGTNKISEAYGEVEYLPTTFYIDRQGKIVGKVAGLIGKAEIERDARKALDSDSGRTAETSTAPAPVSMRTTPQQ